jgi:hypothetical protein
VALEVAELRHETSLVRAISRSNGNPRLML